MSKDSKNPHNELLTAYVDFLASSAQTVAEVYTKTWQDATKFQQTFAKHTTDLFHDNPMYKSVSNLWADHTPWTKK
jgi:hypothetical protein